MELSKTIEIPLKERDEVIELDVNDLPDAVEVMNILNNELSNLSVWINVAHAYYKKKQYSDFETLMEAALKTNAGRHYASYEKDYLRALDLLAIYYVQRSLKEKNKDSRRNLFQLATRHLQAADKIAMYDQNHLLNRAFFFLAEGGESANQADSQLQFVLNQVPNCVPALLGKACVAFNRRDFRNALHLYRRALRTQPNCPASVRVGIGHCFMKQGKPDRARQAYERALELDSECVGALIGLSLINLNEKTQESIKEGVQLLSRAFQLDSTNPMVLNHLADHFFYKKETGKVLRLALHAYHSTENEAMRAESCYHMARAHHSQGNYDRAFQYYYQATQFATITQGYTLPHYGLAQMYLFKNDIDNAALAFEKVLQNHPKNYETLKILGSLYAQSNKPEKRQLGRQYLKQVTETHPDDVEVWIEYAQLMENDTKGSLEAYKRAIGILEDESLPVPAEILNNIACLHYQLGDAEMAQTFYERALARSDEEVSSDERYYKGLKITITYNLGRLYEMRNRTDIAECLYKSILREHASYIDCYLRLGCIARDRGNVYDALDWFKEALKIDHDNPNVWSLLGLLHLQKNEGGPAQKKFERITSQESHRDDPFAQVALGNIWLNTLHHPLRDRERERRHQERALALFKAVLRQRPRNQWAANGIGCVLAHRGLITEARDVFAQVREATADFPDVWINIAHIYVEQKQYVPAVQMYENCIRKFNKQNNTELLLYLARAYFKAGKLHECKQTLLKAHYVNPTDTLLLYNVAFVQKKIATSVLQNEKSTVTAVLNAVTDLKLSQRIFSYLSREVSVPLPPKSTDVDGGSSAVVASSNPIQTAAISGSISSMSQLESRDVADLLAQAKYHVNRAKKLDDQEKNLRLRQEQEREQLRQRQLELQREAEAIRHERESKLEEERQILAAKAKMLRTSGVFNEENEKKSRKSAGGGSKKRKAVDDIIASESDSSVSSAGNNQGENAEGGKKGKSKSEKNRKRSSNQKQKGSKKSRQMVEEEDGLTAKQRSRVRSKPTVSSESSSSSEEDNYHGDIGTLASNHFKSKNSGASSSSSSSDFDELEQSPLHNTSKKNLSGRQKRVRSKPNTAGRGGKKAKMSKIKMLSGSENEESSNASADENVISESVAASKQLSRLLASSDEDDDDAGHQAASSHQNTYMKDQNDDDDQDDYGGNVTVQEDVRPPWADMSSEEDENEPHELESSQMQPSKTNVNRSSNWSEVARNALLSSDEESD